MDMIEGLTLLQLRIMICFYHAGAEGCTNSSLSRTLGLEKYTLSRACGELERMGLLDRSNVRKPQLTEKGSEAAAFYAERMETAISHLCYEGVDVAAAKQDAYYWALYNSEETMRVIRETEVMYRIKNELKDRKSFSGAQMCRIMPDGSYKVPFLVCRNHIQDGEVLSMGNAGFEGPCTMTVKNGIGTLQFHIVRINAVSPRDGIRMPGKVRRLRYQNYGDYNVAEMTGDVITIPASALRFINVGADHSRILYGSVPILLESTVGTDIMPESEAILTVLV